MVKIYTMRRVKGRIYIIGDIHGCLDEFNTLLTTLDIDRKHDRIVLVGDLVNKGYDSIGVVRRAMEVNALSVLGNHEVLLLNAIARIKAGVLRVEEHRDDPYVQLAAIFPEDCYQYLLSLPHVIKIPQYKHTVVHAGLHPNKQMKKQKVWDVLTMRWIRNGRAVSRGGGTPWAQLWRGPNTVVFGHDSGAGLQQEEFAVGLDTGCVYGGELTAYVLPEKQLVQVPGWSPRVE